MTPTPAHQQEAERMAIDCAIKIIKSNFEFPSEIIMRELNLPALLAARDERDGLQVKYDALKRVSEGQSELYVELSEKHKQLKHLVECMDAAKHP